MSATVIQHPGACASPPALDRARQEFLRELRLVAQRDAARARTEIADTLSAMQQIIALEAGNA